MNNFRFQRAEKVTRRKAIIFTIVFHVLLFGGITFGADIADIITTTVKEYFQPKNLNVKKKGPLAKNKK